MELETFKEICEGVILVDKLSEQSKLRQMVEGVIATEYFSSPATSEAAPSLRWVISMTIEESMEMNGVLLFLYSLVDYMKVNMQAVPSSLPEADKVS